MSRSNNRFALLGQPTTRLEAFSDGVFAIAITLLVLELKIPDAASNLPRVLAEQWPSYLGYLVSFAFIGGVWIAHSTLTRFLKSSNQVLMGLNLVLLLFVSLLPFTTGLMATYLRNSEGERLAIVVFGLNLTLASMMVNVLLRYVRIEPGLVEPSWEPDLASFARQRRVAISIQAVATGLALLVPYVAVALYLAISLLVLVDPVVRTSNRKIPS
jgi:uncharacterized membrane protein